MAVRDSVHSLVVRRTFDIVGEIEQVELISRGRGVRELTRLNAAYGAGRWRKLKGIAAVRLPSGETVRAEIHWFEAHGVGMRELKIKRLLG